MIIVADLIKELNLLRKVLPLQAYALEKVHVRRQLVTVNDLLLIEQGNLDLLTELVTKEYLVEVTQIRSDDHLAESGQIKLLFLQIEGLNHQIFAGDGTALALRVTRAHELVQRQGPVEQLELEVTHLTVNG